MTDVYIAPSASSGLAGGRTQQEMELAAFEKGRIQGEMEAARRMEAEQHMQQKQLLPAQDVALSQANLVRPDVIEINRLTWLQRAAAVVGELATFSFLILTIVWLEEYRGSVGWSNSNDGGNVEFWNTHYLCMALGLFFLAQAITNYRMLPLRTHPMINRAWYVFLQSCVIVCFSMALASIVRATPEAELWSVWQWCYCFAYALVMLHSLYSIVVTLLEPLHHRSAAGKYGDWSSTGTHLETPEQRRDHSAYNHQARTVYTAAPAHVPQNLHHTSGAATGSNVPAAPANAPRWAENPRTHSEDYWLLPRAKWAVVGFWAIGTAFLMDIASSQQLLGAGRPNWSQSPALDNDGEGASLIDERGREADLIGALGILTLASLILMAYVAMPPRTALVKNGVLMDPMGQDNRRSSISHNAETRLGGGNIV